MDADRLTRRMKYLYVTPVRTYRARWDGSRATEQGTPSEGTGNNLTYPEKEISLVTTIPPPTFDLDVPATTANVPLEKELPNREETARLYEASKLRMISDFRKAVRDYKLACRRLNRPPLEPCPAGSRENIQKFRESRVRLFSARVLCLKRTIDGIEERRWAILAKPGTDLASSSESMGDIKRDNEGRPPSKEEQEKEEIAERRRELGRALVMERRAQDDARRMTW